jgi:GTP cyclohydrolase II
MQAIRATKTETLWRVADTELPTRWGIFRALGFELWRPGAACSDTAIALILGDPRKSVPVVRIHSQCITGDVLGSLRCDCGEQLELAMRAIAAAGDGLLIYEQQEGRGIGLMAKLQAYELQDQGLDTITANHALGFEADCRDYELPAAILKDLGVRQIRLLSNNPDKRKAMVSAGIAVIEQIPCEVPPSSYSMRYLSVKKNRMGHLLTLV